MKKIFLLAIIIVPFVVSAQESKTAIRKQKQKERRERIDKLIKEQDEGALVYEKQSIFAIKLVTDGYGLFYERGKYKTLKKTNIWWVELAEHKHPKEDKITRVEGGFAVGNPFIYGKVNNFYNLKGGVGQQRLIGGKASKNGIAVSAIYGGGLSLAMMKPYYLTITDPGTGEVRDIKYDDDNALFLDNTVTEGAANFGKGFGEMKYVPGVVARLGLRFDYGSYRETVSAIEVGLNTEFYSQKLKQMAEVKDKRLFFTAYVAIEFGKRK